MDRRGAHAHARNWGLELEGAQLDRLEALVGLWRHYGKAINLSGARSESGLWDHVVEGLQVVACARQAEGHGAWVDVGSGGGFPGLIVGVFHAAPVVLVEPRERRAAFLAQAAGRLGLGQTSVRRARLGPATWDEMGAGRDLSLGEMRFSIASARAVFPVSMWLDRAARVVSPGGLVLVHTHRDGVPPDYTARIDGPRWTVVGVRSGSTHRST